MAPVQGVQAEEPEVEPEKIVESEPVNNYDDMFYENLLQSVRDNPEAQEKLFRGMWDITPTLIKLDECRHDFQIA